MIPSDIELREAIEHGKDLLISLQNHRKGATEVEDINRFGGRINAVSILLSIAQSKLNGELVPKPTLSREGK